MKILYVSQYFPPEMGAPAARASELAHHWSEDGHEVSVLTGFPNHPTGIVPPEWRSRLRRLAYHEKVGRIDVFRTWLWPLPNRKSHERVRNYTSFCLSAARDFDQVRRILLAAFGSNDFDGFELNVAMAPGEIGAVESLDAPAGRRNGHSFHWNKPGRANNLNNSSAWTIALDLLSSSNRQRGTLTVYRLYSTRDLQLDVNLLTAAFPRALADALDRTLSHSAEVIPLPEQDAALITAQAG